MTDNTTDCHDGCDIQYDQHDQHDSEYHTQYDSINKRASFPLFQMLYNERIRHTTGSESISLKQKNKIQKILKTMDMYHMELVYAIIRCYHLQIDKHSIYEIPYGMKKIKTHHYKIDMNELPLHLLLILLRFCELYETKQGIVVDKEDVTAESPNLEKGDQSCEITVGQSDMDSSESTHVQNDR